MVTIPTRNLQYRWLKLGMWAVAALLIAVLAAVSVYLVRVLPVGTGFVAKYLCSSSFIALRDPMETYAEDVVPVNPLTSVIRWRIHRRTQRVTADTFGLFKATAVYRPECGCTLVRGKSEAELERQRFLESDPHARPVAPRADLPWPHGGQGVVTDAVPGVDYTRLDRALEKAFEEPGPAKERLTRAVVVIYRGRLVAERYAPGFHHQMPMPGWSMSKSVTNAIVGILVNQKWLDVHALAPVKAWQGPQDPRRAITIDQLLRMSSGLAFSELYSPLDDVTTMLYKADDFDAYAARKPLVDPPDSQWHYSSGTANIVAGIIRQTVEAKGRLHYEFIYDHLFHRIGMRSVVMEPDPSGTFVGSSYIWATARDWARFGLLYLQDGEWGGRRLLPRGWVEYSVSPTPRAPRGQYGAHFWLNAGSPGNPSRRPWPSAPRDTYAAQGYHEQKLFIIPSKQLVLVRLGATSARDAWNSDPFLADVIAALPADR